MSQESPSFRRGSSQSILDDWASTHPHEARLVKELRELDAMAASKYATVEVSSYLHPSRPPELANVPDALQQQWR